MQTSSISYRVADFLKQHPPFQSIEEADLVALASHGRVRFHESGEFILWQGAAHKPHVFVVQQGTVAVWETPASADGTAVEDEEILRDIRGPGELVGIERFAGAETSPYSVKSTSDVLLYAFPATDFATLIENYPHARDFVAIAAAIGTEYQAPETRPTADATFLNDFVCSENAVSCAASSSIRAAAAALRASGREAVALVDEQGQAAGVITADHLLQWIEEGGADGSRPVADLANGTAGQCVLPLDASVSDCVLRLGENNAAAAVITDHGSPGEPLRGLVTAADLAPAFGEQPQLLLREIHSAPDFDALCELNHRTRSLLGDNLRTSAAVDWLAKFAHLADAAIFRRTLGLLQTRDEGAPPHARHCWCFFGAAGRRESLTQVIPNIALLVEDGVNTAEPWNTSVRSALARCGYVAAEGAEARDWEDGWYSASIGTWEERYAGWLRDPIENDIYRARSLFDLLPVHGDRELYERLAAVIGREVNQGFLYLLANDCLANLPPMTFFQDAIVDSTGEQSAVFDLAGTALGPLVDVGRVVGLVAHDTPDTSTSGRFRRARTLSPTHDGVFREASAALQAVLFHQARVGIREGTGGGEIPPALLSGYDRQVLKRAFRSILQLLEYMADSQWLQQN